MTYINNKKNMIVTLTLKKEIECINVDMAEHIYESLSELKDKKETFGQVHIPNFTYGRDENIVWYECDYIKGRIIERVDLEKIVWNECVLREDTFTLTNYGCPNYIWCNDSHKLYYIDLDDCRHASYDERMLKWNKEIKTGK